MNEQEIKALMVSCKSRISVLKKELALCPEGKLSEQRINGKAYFIRKHYENGKLIRTGISKEPDKINGLIKRRFYEDELCCLEKILVLLNETQNNLIKISPREEMKLIQKDCPSISDDMISEALRPKDQGGWATAEYEKSLYKPEEKRHITSRGLRVRSKSEVLIAEKLYEHNIDFRYEQVIRIKGLSYAPDFTIRRNDGKIFIWEHEGLMSDKTYQARQLEKAQAYTSVGIVPWDNFIVTYDNQNGDIDLRIVESEIQNKLLI